jgi:hypothetical protein
VALEEGADLRRDGARVRTPAWSQPRVVVKPDDEQGSPGDHRSTARPSRPRRAPGETASEIRTLPARSAFVELLERRSASWSAGAATAVLVAACYRLERGGRHDRQVLNVERSRRAGFVHVEQPEDAAKIAAVDDRTFVVVMTRSFRGEYLRCFLNPQPTSACRAGRPDARC